MQSVTVNGTGGNKQQGQNGDHAAQICFKMQFVMGGGPSMDNWSEASTFKHFESF